MNAYCHMTFKGKSLRYRHTDSASFLKTDDALRLCLPLLLSFLLFLVFFFKKKKTLTFTRQPQRM